jgi:transcriptional regulator with XRE-family HTH domain
MGRRRNKGDLLPHILRAARALLDLTQDDLAAQTGISSSTIRRFEGGIPMNIENHAKMVAYLKEAGIVFLYREGEIVGLMQGGDLDVIFDF